MKFRHELKYLLNYGDAELVRERLGVILQGDAHARGGSYSVRSLYFDDYWDTAYRDKMAGVSSRRKYRIRLYNRDDAMIRLECKIKRESYISKISAPLSRAETDSIMKGDYGFLLRREEPVCRQFYCECVSRVLRPRVYVEYEREPYVMEPGDVRITFDRDVRGASPAGSIDEDDKMFLHVLEPGKLIMEVKFTEFLPRMVREVLPSRAAELSAVSKYTLCCDKMNYLSACEAEGMM